MSSSGAITLPARSVTAIIPALHRPDLTARCLQSLAKQSFPPEQLQIIVVENQAEPGKTLDPLPGGNIQQILLEKNLGTTGSVNRALAESVSPYVLLLNNDVELEASFLAVLRQALESREELGFVTGKLLSASEPGRLDGAGDAMLLGGGAYRLGHQDLDQGQFDTEREVLAGCGAAVLFRRSVLEAIEGLDENFFAYLDDVDLCLRAELAGCKGIYVPQAVGYHVGSATLGDRAHPQIVRWMTRNQIFLVLKNYPLPLLFRLLPRIAVYQLLWCMLDMKRGAFYPYLLGIRDSLFSLLPILRKRRAVMRNKKISNTEFLDLLRQSEGQVYEWHMQQPEHDRSTLLKLYFRLCCQPTRSARK